MTAGKGYEASGSISHVLVDSAYQPSDRSRHSGLAASTARSFHERFQPFIRVSCSIAGHEVMLFEPHQGLAAVAPGKPFELTGLMLAHPLPQVAGHAQVERAVAP